METQLAQMKSQLVDPKELKEAQAEIAVLNESLSTLKMQMPKLTNVEGENKKLSDVNSQLQAEAQQFKAANEQMKTQLEELNAKLKESSENMSANEADRLKQFEALESENLASIEQNKTLNQKIETLTKENADMKNRIDQKSETHGQMLSQKAELDAAAKRLPELETKVASLSTENESFKQLNEKLSKTNKKLVDEIGLVRQRSDALQAQYLTATQEKKALGDRIAELSAQSKANKIVALSSESTTDVADAMKAAAPASDSEPANQEPVAAKRDASQSSASALLLEDAGDLSTEIDQLDETENAPVAPVSGPSAGGSDNTDLSKYSQLSWLVPFLAMLFSIGIFCLFREDYSRKSKS